MTNAAPAPVLDPPEKGENYDQERQLSAIVGDFEFVKDRLARFAKEHGSQCQCRMCSQRDDGGVEQIGHTMATDLTIALGMMKLIQDLLTIHCH